MFQRIDLNGKIKNEFIAVMYETKNHKILIGTSTKGLFVCDMDMKVQKNYTSTTSFLCLPNNNVSALYEDSKGYIWGGSNLSGLFRMNIDKDEIVHYHKGNSVLTTNSVRCIAEAHGILLVGTFDGLYTIDLSDDSFWKHTDASLEKGNLSHFSIYSLFVDSSQTIWVGTYAGGVSYRINLIIVLIFMILPVYLMLYLVYMVVWFVRKVGVCIWLQRGVVYSIII